MKTIQIIIALIITFSYSKINFAQESTQFRRTEVINRFINQNSGFKNSSDLNDKIKFKEIAKDDTKSPILGALLSGVIPGAGEFYAKSFIKSAIFFGLEAGLWTAYSVFQKKGNDQTESFQNFADNNWDIYKYGRWLKEQSFSGADGIDLTADKYELRRKINIVEAQNFSHQLPPFGEQQYYELIGKYQNFVTGWADADLSVVNRNNYGSYKTEMFIGYSYDRQKANDYYNKGTTSLTLVVLNHLLSSADAAWSVSMFNKDLKVKAGLKMKEDHTYYGQKKVIPVAEVKITF